ncbi:PhoPQ-activated pathogenicity-related family protein [Flavilitoribacter nigricans]|uniref:PhoPQ-activated pathogenicity-like protein PqaA type n=1 Tax=Flavilitoribacter nigricans (strain ATCC 23147 / DSM 23189 / NBRC 102662 / NCIMB 1420 / SS-2) TaxID=1122177 RepID=A0A2D0NCN7_FLAN2|nr:PhoPQ-activated protein PqaA family protein [Flavilitoribacter nigricans]PHN06271.1 PhoPQ-activated pathogenicity-like protein PqaA type [Flavilitoribacter nigricans DSM 23189 = NBRC 102662]
MFRKKSILFFVVLLFLTACKTNQKSLDTSGPTTAENALSRYLHNDDQTFDWEIKEAYDLGPVKAYVVLLTSQKWREHTWVHQLTVLVPNKVSYDGALLFITGKGLKNGQPDWRKHDDGLTRTVAAMAQKNEAITTILWQTPNQPLYDGLTEDALISYTLHNFKADGDFTWPLLFPMVKSATKAMDAVQAFSQQELKRSVNRFVVTGASKRGWTTWLTGASDDRVAAIAPMVIDVLNMPVNLNYQVEVWKEYSIQIEDYVKLGIVQEMQTGRGPEITRMIDPYAYRANLDMPKLIFIGTNDEYWPVDAVKHYFADIPGENYIHYVPNAGHDLGGGEQALRALSAFFGQTLRKEKYPVTTWNIRPNGKSASLTVKATSDQLKAAALWWADSQDRDFRDEQFQKKDLDQQDVKRLKTEVEYPASGYRAFYLDLEYEDPNGGHYTKSTRMFVADAERVL